MLDGVKNLFSLAPFIWKNHYIQSMCTYTDRTLHIPNVNDIDIFDQFTIFSKALPPSFPNTVHAPCISDISYLGRCWSLSGQTGRGHDRIGEGGLAGARNVRGSSGSDEMISQSHQPGKQTGRQAATWDWEA